MAKKVLALILAVMMIAALAASAVAADETGKITITNASAGQKYELFKLLDATYNTTTQTTAYSTQDPDLKSALAAAKSGENAIFIVGANPDTEGNYSVAVADGMSEAALTWIKANAATYGTNVKEVIFDSVNKIEWDVPYGYYYVKSGLGALLTINSNTPSVEIIDKNDTAPKDAQKQVDKLSADVGETVTYKVTFTATNFVTEDAKTEQITSYVITDTAVGVTLNSDIKVTVDGTEKTDAAKAFDNNKLTLSWVDEAGNSIYKSPAKVEITYTGTVTKEAIGKNAVNEVKISYVTNSGTESIPDPDPVTTKVYSVDITKVNDETGEKQKKLEGAEFVLIKMTGGKETFYKWSDDKGVTWEDSVENATSKKTDSDGTAKFEGFAAGTYYLREIDSPKGYALPEEDFDVDTADADAYDTNRVAVTVENKAGSKLPTTGGIGTTVFYVMGSILVIGAAVVLLSKKRMRG